MLSDCSGYDEESYLKIKTVISSDLSIRLGYPTESTTFEPLSVQGFFGG